MRQVFLDRYADRDSPLHALDARAKIIACLALVMVSVTTPPEAVGAFAGYLALIVTAIILSRVPLGYVFRRSLTVIPFVLMTAAFIPFFHAGGTGASPAAHSGTLLFWNVLIKAYAGGLCVITLSVTTPLPKLLHGFGQLKAPPILVMLAGFVYRYLFVLADEALRMKRAHDARAYQGRWLWQARTIGHLIGALFLRSYERGERVYVAMVSRGFTGRATGFGAAPLTRRDYAFLTGVLVSALAIRTCA